MSGSSPILLLAALAALAGCGLDPRVIGGDAPTEPKADSASLGLVSIRAITPTGALAAHALVEVWSADSLLVKPVALATTDSRGEAVLRVPRGSWSVVVRKDGKAFQARVRDSGAIVDTLRTPGSLVGIVRGGSGQEVSIPGLGVRTRCDTLGFFRLDSLVGGEHPLLAGSPGRPERTSVLVRGGRGNMVLGTRGELPSAWSSLPTDSLIAWDDPSRTLRLPRGALGFHGDFAVAVRFHRPDTTSPLQVFSWTDGLSQGVKIGWRGADTVHLTVDGRTLVGIGVRLDTGERQVGFSWQEGIFTLVVDADSVASFSYPTAAERGVWSVPTIGAQGIRLDWVAFRRGGIEQDWIPALSRR